MSVTRRLASTFLLVLAAAAVFAGSAAAKAIPDRYIVVLNDSVRSPGAVADEHARKDGARVSNVFSHALKGYAATIPANRVDDVRNDPRVAAVTPDYEVHALGTAPLAPGDSIPTGILREGAAADTTVGTAASSAVAVIDTGIDLTHPDLNAAPGKNCITSGAAPNDDNGHGSHVSGTIAARNNGSGVVGAVPGTQLYAVKVLNAQGSGDTASVVCGIDWVTANAAALKIKVANMSLGGTGSALQACSPTMSDAEHWAICNATTAGVTFVVAAGNSGWDFDYAPAPDVPAAYPEVLTVTAMSDSDGKPGAIGGAPTCRTGELDDSYASFSNYALTSGGIAHTIAGPGVCIRSTWMNGGYNTISGTSMATPNAAGVVAACLDDTSASGCAGGSPAAVIQQMRTNAQNHATSANGFTGDPFHPASTRYFGYLAWGGFASVVPPAPTGDFSLSASPSSVTVRRGGSSGRTTITVTPSGGFSGSVSLSANCPQRVTCSFSPNPATGSSTMTITANRRANVGTYSVTVTGSSNGITHTTPITLTVQ